MPVAARPLIERWEEKVERLPGDDACWRWLGAIKENGYGVINSGDGRTLRAHRVAYEHFVGPIPEGHEMRHRCHDRACVNPTHLTTGTRAENMRDMVAAGRWNVNGQRETLRGATNGKAKLTAEQVLAIRADDRLLREVAADYGVSVPLISAIRTRRLWAWL